MLTQELHWDSKKNTTCLTTCIFSNETGVSQAHLNIFWETHLLHRFFNQKSRALYVVRFVKRNKNSTVMRLKVYVLRSVWRLLETKTVRCSYPCILIETWSQRIRMHDLDYSGTEKHSWTFSFVIPYLWKQLFEPWPYGPEFVVFLDTMLQKIIPETFSLIV